MEPRIDRMSEGTPPGGKIGSSRSGAGSLFGLTRRALVRGLSILLPALITVGIFVWGWGVLKDYVVVGIINGIDAPKIFPPPQGFILPPELNDGVEFASSPSGKPYWRTPDRLVYRVTTSPGHGASLHSGRAVYLLEDQSYSLLALGSAWLEQRRSYDYSSGRATSYTVMEYVISITLVVILIVLLGIFARNLIGKRFMALLDKTFRRLPAVNLVYPYAKQVVDFFFSEHKQIEFKSVVAVEWPREGCYQLGFVTGSGLISLAKGAGVNHTTVFVPMSPLPMTGFTVFVPKEQVMEIDLTVEEAFMIILSGGVLSPPAQHPGQETPIDREWERLLAGARDERARIRAEEERATQSKRQTRTRQREAETERRTTPPPADGNA